jgi:hypothetical protein
MFDSPPVGGRGSAGPAAGPAARQADTSAAVPLTGVGPTATSTAPRPPPQAACPPHVLAAIHGSAGAADDAAAKKAAYDRSLNR